MAGTTYTRGGIQDKVAQKATDPAFRKSLMANPKASLEKVLGAEIPKGVNVKVLEESADTYYVVLPHTTKEGAELDDASLEKVAGGMMDKAKCSASMSPPASRRSACRPTASWPRCSATARST